MYNKEQLLKLVHERALKFGDFTLASGKKSNFYLDGRQVTLFSHGLRSISEGILDLLADVEYEAVGGMSIGADPIVGGVVTIAAEQGRDLAGFLVRKELKKHGTQRYVEGPVEPGMKVVIVEDTVTTGGSALQAVDRAEEFGCEVVQLVGIIDRLEGGKEAFAERGIPFTSLLTIEDLGIEAASKQ